MTPERRRLVVTALAELLGDVIEREQRQAQATAKSQDQTAAREDP